jgi:phage FluMu gp28-like protein
MNTTYLNPQGAESTLSTESTHSNLSPSTAHFLPYQLAWINDASPLKIIEKSRQIGLTYADAYDSVRKACGFGGFLDVWISSRDENTARRYIDQCKQWALKLHIEAEDLGYRIIEREKDLGAYVLRFATDLCIYSLSSTPDALVGKTGHIKLDEFAIHRDGRELYRIAKPCTTWGGQLSIISTHRGDNSVFNNILRDIKERGNPMGWSHHRVTLHDAVGQGLVERINARTGRAETRETFLQRLRAECLDQEQWHQEYCCNPGSDTAAFLSYQLLTPCEEPNCIQPFDYLTADSSPNPLYVGVDVARLHDLCVIDVGELIGDVIWDRLRIELRNQTFSVIEQELFRILALPRLQRCCIDATGLGMQLAERARERFGWKVEKVTFTDALKERLAFDLRTAFEERRLRIDSHPELRADLRALRRTVTEAGNLRFIGDSPDSHCDRFWAKALRQHAAATPVKTAGAAVA